MLRKLDDDCKKSWDYLRVIAKHESSSSVKPRYMDIFKRRLVINHFAMRLCFAAKVKLFKTETIFLHQANS